MDLGTAFEYNQLVAWTLIADDEDGTPQRHTYNGTIDHYHGGSERLWGVARGGATHLVPEAQIFVPDWARPEAGDGQIADERNADIDAARADLARATQLVSEAPRGGCTAILPQLERSMNRRADRLAALAFGA